MSLVHFNNHQTLVQLLGVSAETAEKWTIPLSKMFCCGVTTCVTNYENFFALCIDHMVLTVAILNRADIRADPIDYSPASYCKAAYRQYILWMHGFLGRGNRRVILSCVIWAVRHFYPSVSGTYMGFREY